MFGTSISQLVSVLSMLLLARIYSPEEFGTFALYSSALSVLSVIITARYELAIILPSEDDDSIALWSISVIVSFVIAAILFLILFFFGNEISALAGKNLGSGAWVIPISLICIGIYQSYNYWNIRSKNFKILSLSKVCQTFIAAGAQILMGMNNIKKGLIFGLLIGQAASMIYLAWATNKKNKISFNNIDEPRIINNLKNYRQFPLYSIWGALLDTSAAQMPIFLLTKFFSTLTVGYFSLTFRVLNLPLSLISSSLSQVLLQKIVEVNNHSPNELKKYVWRIFFYLVLIVIPFILIFYFFGENLFGLVFGEEWKYSGQLASLLVVAVAVRFVVSPLSAVFALEGNIRLGTLWQFIYFITIISTLTLSRNLPIADFLKIFVLHEIILYGLYFKFILKACSKKPLLA